MDIKVICKNHGIIQVIPTGVTWLNGPPSPYPFCPHCGEPTKVEYPEPSPTYNVWSPLTQEELTKQKESEIQYYRKKYWGDN